MSKVNFTVARVEGFKCPKGKTQAFLWDSKSPGLGLRVTIAGSKSYIFQGKINGQSIRLTIGDSRSWSIELAQEESRRLQRLIDSGIDPRTYKAEKAVAEQAKKVETRRQDTTFGEAWDLYVDARKPRWSDRHYHDHVNLACTGRDFKRGQGTTQPGPIAVLRPLKLVELNSDKVATWLQHQNIARPTVAALSYRLLRAFIRWADDTPEYKELIPNDAHSSRRVKDSVARSKAKDGDCLQREQLSCWFKAVRALENPVQSAYLQGLLITGARREELAALRWEDVDFKWRSLTIGDKIETEDGRVIPLTPYLASLLNNLKIDNETPPTNRQLLRMKEKRQEWKPSPWVFSSKAAADGKISEPRIAHIKALAAAELPHLTLHGLRRSFGTLAEWVECPTGIVAQIMGHKPSAIAEKHYRRRSIDLLRVWHDKIEAWIIGQANIEFDADDKSA